MKKFYFVIIFLLPLFTVTYSQNSFRIEGKVSNPTLNGKNVYLYEYGVESAFPLDSAKVTDQKFRFTGKQPESVLRDIRFSTKDVPPKRIMEGENTIFNCTFVLENKSIRILLDTISYASGTVENNALKEFQLFLASQRKEQQALMYEFHTADNDRKGIMELEYRSIERNIIHQAKEYISLHLNDVSGGKLLYDFRNSLTTNELREIINRANNKFKSVPTTQKLIEHLEL